MKTNLNNEIIPEVPNKENENGAEINQKPGNENAKEPTGEAAPAQEENTNTENSSGTESGEQLNAVELAAENEKLKRENAILKLNIKDNYRDDAISLADKLVNSECDFTQALNKVVEKYPQFINSPAPKLNLGGPTGGIRFTNSSNRDAFVSGIKNRFLGG